MAPILICIGSMVISLLKVKPLSGKRDAVLDVLRSVMGLILGLPGCMGCACYEESNRERAILYVEKWESKEALHRHIKSSVYNRVISAMEFAGEVPEITFHEVSEPMGLELIEALRSDLVIPKRMPLPDRQSPGSP